MIADEVVEAARELVESDRAVDDARRHGSLADVARAQMRRRGAMDDLHELFPEDPT